MITRMLIHDKAVTNCIVYLFIKDMFKSKLRVTLLETLFIFIQLSFLRLHSDILDYFIHL